MAIAIVRTLILYSAIVISMRIMGKRQLGELEPAELVVAVLISDLASHPLQDIGTPLLYGLIPVITLITCEILISGAIIKSLRFRTLICGKPSLIIENGTINQREMQKNRFTLDELSEQLRKNDVLDISTVQYAVLETNGTLSTILYPDKSPATPEQLGISGGDSGYPIIIINDGRMLEKNLRAAGYNEAWLINQLRKQSISSARNVYMMSVDTCGRVYIAKKEPVK